MVGPATDRERRGFLRRIKAAFALLVGVSAALIAVRAGAGVAPIVAAGVVGTAVGVVLVWIAFPRAAAVDREDRSFR